MQSEIKVLKKDVTLYEKGQKVDKLYFIKDGIIEIEINDEIKKQDSGSVGEWALLKIPAVETVRALKGAKIVSVSPENLLKMKEYGKLLLKIFKSITFRLNFVDEIISPNISPGNAMETFSNIYKGYTFRENDFILHYRIMKKYYRENKLEDAAKELEKIDVRKLDLDMHDELEIWKSILKYKLNPQFGKEYLHRVYSKDSKKRLSYNYFETLVNKENNAFYDLYGKYGLHVPKKTVLIVEGDRAKDIGYLLLKGGVKVARFSEGEENILAVILNGEFFGEATLFNERKRQATVFSDKPFDVIEFSKETLSETFEKSPEFGLKLIQNQLKRIVNTLKMDSILKLDPYNRINELFNNFYTRFINANMTINELSRFANVKISDVIDVTLKRNMKIDPEGHIK
ncbi:hypothetical protein OSSY52_15840 [Tepiditoga spiralis]|uniref:Cyclic nucleotide-binding domain-containing protein n=1 Tax=Tepiditoga spiralis TaxID=2108365 RepID=A0A7G1G939_9BACT|nr:cyclic nucleotide-binding domain-containing protein [Tepiditoga spiralis]BBE31443.1 hypothetical protein OSSY52_15840 [Tepiditoga spiralis]